MMKAHASVALLVCCLIGLGAGSALGAQPPADAVPVTGAQMMLVPAGVQPGDVTTTPFTYTAAPGELIRVEVWVDGTASGGLAGWQVQMPCTAARGNGGSIEFAARSLDQAHKDYIFAGRRTLGSGGNDGACSGGGMASLNLYKSSPVTGTMAVDGPAAPRAVAGWKYLCDFTYTVSSDATGVFKLDPLCYSGGSDANCTTSLTFVATRTLKLIPVGVEPLLIDVQIAPNQPKARARINARK